MLFQCKIGPKKKKTLNILTFQFWSFNIIRGSPKKDVWKLFEIQGRYEYTSLHSVNHQIFKKKKGMSLACHIGLLSDNTLAGKVVNDTKLFHLSLTNNLGHLKSALNETNKTKFSLWAPNHVQIPVLIQFYHW